MSTVLNPYTGRLIETTSRVYRNLVIKGVLPFENDKFPEVVEDVDENMTPAEIRARARELTNDKAVCPPAFKVCRGQGMFKNKFVLMKAFSDEKTFLQRVATSAAEEIQNNIEELIQSLEAGQDFKEQIAELIVKAGERHILKKRERSVLVPKSEGLFKLA